MKKNINNLEYYLKLDYDIIVESELHDEDKSYIAYCHELGKGSCYGISNTPIDAVQNFFENKEDFITILYEQNIIIPEPMESMKEDDILSGFFNVRTSPLIHGKLVRQARANCVSLNMFLNQILAKSTVEQSFEKLIDEKTEKIIDKIDEHHKIMSFNMVQYNPQPIATSHIKFDSDWTPKKFMDN